MSSGDLWTSPEVLVQDREAFNLALFWLVIHYVCRAFLLLFSTHAISAGAPLLYGHYHASDYPIYSQMVAMGSLEKWAAWSVAMGACGLFGALSSVGWRCVFGLVCIMSWLMALIVLYFMGTGVFTTGQTTYGGNLFFCGLALVLTVAQWLHRSPARKGTE